MELLFNVEDPTYAYPLKGIPNKKSKHNRAVLDKRYSDTIYVWKLSKYVGKIEDEISFFSYYRMSEKVGELSYLKVLSSINSKQWYNFEYEPQEGDYLSVFYKYMSVARPGRHRPYLPYTFFSFIFKDGWWTYDRYYNVNLQLIAEGILYVK